MSSCYRRVMLGAAVIAWTTSAAAQQQPERANAPSSETFVAREADSYVADDATSDVVEFPQDAAPSRNSESAPRAYAETQPIYEPAPQRQAAPQCTQYEEAVVAHGETRSAYGTACQQPDGSWRIVSAPSVDRTTAADRRTPPRGPDSRSYCREYQQTIYANGRAEAAYGQACLQPDGSWRVVTPPSMEVASADYARTTPHHVTSASERAAEGRGYTPPDDEGTVYYITRPRRSPLRNLFFRWID